MTPSIRIRYNSPVILSFALISLLALGIARLTNDQSNMLLFSVYPSSWSDPLTYVRLITHVLGHVDWVHFSGNIMFMLLLEPLLEEKYGSLQIAVVILVTALVTGLSQVLFFEGALMGASGVVFAFIILTSMTGIEKGGIPLTFLLVTAVYLGGEIYQMFAVNDNISQITHVIGGIVGALSGYLMHPKQPTEPVKAKVVPIPTTPLPPLFPEDQSWKRSDPFDPMAPLGEKKPEPGNPPLPRDPF